MAIVRTSKRDNLAFFDRTVLHDERLSYRAKGIAAYLLGHPDGWEIMTSDLVNRSTDGRDSVYAGLRELKDAGYITDDGPQKDESGKFSGNGYTIHETPVRQNAKPHTDLPDTVSPDTENPLRIYNTSYSNEGDYSSDEENESPPMGGDGAVWSFLENNGVFLNPHTKDRYVALLEEYGIESVLRGAMAAADNGKLHMLNYVASCIHNQHHGLSPKKDKASDSDEPWTEADLSEYSAINR